MTTNRLAGSPLLWSLLILSIISTGRLQAQTGEIYGRVTDGKTGQLLAGANIVIEELGIGATSADDGRFFLSAVALPVELTFTRIGYADTTLTVALPGPLAVLMRPVVLTGELVQIEVLRAVRGDSPVAFSTLDRETIERRYSHQDVPMVLASQPGVYAYSDAGNGVGYTYLKIRGFSQDRIGVYLNGIPLNDPEAHAVYWVDHGDILADAGDIQLQRGVGNSLYGSGVFGGSVNLSTGSAARLPGLRITAGWGNYSDEALDLPSQKLSASFSNRVPALKDWQLFGRVSSLSSAGYRKGSGTGQQSAHFGGERASATSLTRLEAHWGHEETAFSWEGVIPAYGYLLTDRQDRRYNYYADRQFNAGRSDANKDVFTQSILSLQHSRKLGSRLASITIYTVKGDGYYEQVKTGRDTGEYNLLDIVPDGAGSVDLMRRRWLRNGYSGAVGHLTLPMGRLRLTVGGDIRYYRARHYGKVLELLSEPVTVPVDHRYYSDTSRKTSFSLFLHSRWDIMPALRAVADFRYLGHRYAYRQSVLGAFMQGYEFNLRHDFFDPHLGLIYEPIKGLSIFGNVSTAKREPANSDIYDHDDPSAVPLVDDMAAQWAQPLVRSEALTDYELGISLDRPAVSAQLNLYRMDFRDELIPAFYRYTDADEVFHANAPRTVHQGIEGSLSLAPLPWLQLSGNFSVADNRFVEFTGDSLGWGGYGGTADYADKVVPAFPLWQRHMEMVVRYGDHQGWLELQQIGPQYIDFLNTEAVAIDAYTVANLGISLRLPAMTGLSGKVTLRVNNLADRLYETFGYTYFDGDPPQQIAAYWPGATRSYFLELQLQR
ncbi:MAG: TonB-dependent receptor [Candidatus Marinimicrobia bacterium]|nr:TonB-dependent receptor [Candidatus Neomarinimicrobiota bacterium]